MTEMSHRKPQFFTHPTGPGRTVIRGRSPTLVQPHGRTATPKPTYEKNPVRSSQRALYARAALHLVSDRPSGSPHSSAAAMQPHDVESCQPRGGGHRASL